MVFTHRPFGHLGSLATGVGLGRIPRSSDIVRFVQGGVLKTFRCPDEIIGVANPYESPTTENSLADPPITDAIVQRLIDGTDTETLVFYDVSDCQIYGSKHRRNLSGALAEDAANAGCEPTAYQTILWFCLVYMPVWPLGTYFVMPCLDCDDPDGDAEQYRGVRAASDTGQIMFHYSVMAALIVAAGVAVWYWWH